MQFISFRNLNSPKHSNPNTPVYARVLKDINFNLLTKDFSQTNWRQVLKIDENNVNLSFQLFESSTSSILDKHAPFKKLSNRGKQLQTKPWLTKNLLKSVQVKNNLYNKMERSKNSDRKDALFFSFQAIQKQNYFINKTM